MNNRQVAMIWGVTGQIGSYLCEFLLKEQIQVVGISRRSSTPNTANLQDCINKSNFVLEEGDITDSFSVRKLIDYWKPNYIVNAAAQSHVFTSFSQPKFTNEVIYGGSLNILESLRHYKNTNEKYFNSVKYIHLSSSEQFGSSVSSDGFQRESTPFSPCSPYAISKLAAHNLTILYREGYGLWAANAILFNTESSRRGNNFVTKKIVNWLGDIIATGSFYKIKLGNILTSRDWGHAKDRAAGIYMMLLGEDPDDFVFSTGYTRTIKQFLTDCIIYANLEKADGFLISKYVEQDSSLFRCKDVIYLKGDSTKARQVLQWDSVYSYKDIVKEMMDSVLLGD